MPRLDRNALEALFERLLEPAEPAAKAAAPVDAAVATARLAAALDAGKAAPQAETGDPLPLLAAYIDGSPDEAALRGVEARMAVDPAALHEVAAGLAYVDRIAAAQGAAPQALLDAAIARLPAPAARRGAPRRSPRPLRAWQWSSAAAALVVLVVAGAAMLRDEAPAPFRASDAARSGESRALTAPLPAPAGEPRDSRAATTRQAVGGSPADCPPAARYGSRAEAGKAADLRTPPLDRRGADTACEATAGMGRAKAPAPTEAPAAAPAAPPGAAEPPPAPHP